MNVNYMAEIIALDEWELTHPLDATAYKVMRKLYHLAYKERFPERISVPNTVLMALVGCSEESLRTARDRLKNIGRIDYQGQKKLTPRYWIQYFSNEVDDNANNWGYGQGMNQGYGGGMHQGYAQGYDGGSLKEIETGDLRDEDLSVNRKRTEGSARVREDLFPARTRSLSAAEQPCYDGLRDRFATSRIYDGYRNRLLTVLNSDRFSLDLIVLALEKTEQRHRRDPMDNPGAYLMHLLHDWEERGLRTSDDVMDSKNEWWLRA